MAAKVSSLAMSKAKASKTFGTKPSLSWHFLKYAAIAGDSFTGARLSAVTGASSAIVPGGGFTTGFAGPSLDGGAALPPLMARRIGMSLLVFAGNIFPAAFADLLVLGISTSL